MAADGPNLQLPVLAGLRSALPSTPETAVRVSQFHFKVSSDFMPTNFTKCDIVDISLQICMHR